MTDSFDSPVARYLGELHARFASLDAGEVATYIPEIARADPNWFGISVATADGHVYEVGDTRQPFTIQSISKPFVYGLALEDRGKPAVLEKVGVEPTGDAFNEISLESGSGRPKNPMINAGAITATSLVNGNSSQDRWERILTLFSLYAGRNLEVDEVVYRSERDTGHRNRAISHMLRNFEIVEGEPETDLDLYFRQCSILVDCRDLGVIAATIAMGGTNPVTRGRVIHPDSVDEVLSVMTTCGMYDYAGEWVYRVGLPAKSGVAGGILAVLPGQLGIGVFSPPLDARGNSVRGVAVCEAMSEDLELHFLRAPRVAISTVRSRSTLRSRVSKRMRSDLDRRLLEEEGDSVVAYELQGDLNFAGVEVVVRRVTSEPGEVRRILLDFSRVGDVDRPAQQMLVELYEALSLAQREVAFVGLQNLGRLQRALEEGHATFGARRFAAFDDLDAALEWCEGALLALHRQDPHRSEELPLAKHELTQGMSGAQIRSLESVMERHFFDERDFVVRRGDAADTLFLLADGALSVLSETRYGRLQRLSTLSPGMAFGEAALVDCGHRSASVRADAPSVCWALKRSALERIEESDPEIKLRLLENLLRSASITVGRLTRDVLSERG